MRQMYVVLKITDGNHEYDSNVILTRSDDFMFGKDPALDLDLGIARLYMTDFFGEKETRQDRHDHNLFWDRNDVRNAKIMSVLCLSDAEFDFLKHFLNVASVNPK